MKMTTPRSRSAAVLRDWRAVANDCSERKTESKLKRPGLVRDVRVLRGLPVLAVAFLRRVRAIVLMVEEIEHLEDTVKVSAPPKANPLLKAQIHAMDRITNEVVPWSDRTVWPQPGRADGCVP
jgi:hypothetical protein